MATLSHNDLLTLNRAIGDIYAARDMESFYGSMFRSVQSLMPGELCSYSDVTLQPIRFLKVISASQDHSYISKKFFSSLNNHLNEHPLISRFDSNNVYKTSDEASKSQFKNMDIYNEYYRHLDVETQIGLSIPLSQNKVSLLAISRRNPDYSEEDRLILTLLRPHLINALRNVMELDCIKLERDLLHKGEESERRGAILFQSDGMILCISPMAREMLAKYFNTVAAEGDTLPGELLQWFNTETNPAVKKRATARVSGSVERVPLTIIKEDHKIKIKFMNDVTTGDYILTIVETNNSLIMHSMQGYGLSSRETEVLLWLSQGKTNAEIAIILTTSKRTIEKHLERVFAKLGVVNRAAAAAIIGT